MSWRQNKTDPHSYGHNSVSFPFSWVAQPGPGGPASLGHGLHSNVFSPTDWTSCAPSYIIIWRLLLFLRASQFALNSTRPRSRLYPDIPRPDAPVIHTGAFTIWRAWLGSICYTFYTHILNIWFQTHFVDNFFKRLWAHFLHTVNRFHLFNLIRIIPFTITHLLAHS